MHIASLTRTQQRQSIAEGKTVNHWDIADAQYAALNVAALQVSFQHYQSALEYLQESVRLAQHQADTICVTIALAWQIQVQK